MAKRPRYSRWRRLPGVSRFGDTKRPDPNLEPQRLTLYLTWDVLDAAEALSAQAGGGSIQDYCTQLLEQAIDAERVRSHVAGIEAQRGPFAGLNEIADDPEYLAEWSAQAQSRERSGGRTGSQPVRLQLHTQAPSERASPPDGDQGDGTVSPAETGPGPDTSPDPRLPAMTQGNLSAAALVVLRHTGQAGEGGPSFLTNLRRGEGVPVAEVAELARALHELEKESRDATSMDRRLAYALYRLAFEAQVLHTDAWPGAFDDWTVDTLRAVQEAVERILSGQDIRYDSPGTRLEIPL